MNRMVLFLLVIAGLVLSAILLLKGGTTDRIIPESPTEQPPVQSENRSTDDLNSQTNGAAHEASGLPRQDPRIEAFLSEMNEADHEILRYELRQLTDEELDVFRKQVESALRNDTSPEQFTYSIFHDVVVHVRTTAGRIGDHGEYSLRGQVVNGDERIGSATLHISIDDEVSGSFKLRDAEYRILPTDKPPDHIVYRVGFYELDPD